MNRYIKPGKGDGFFNVAVQFLTRMGVSLAGSRVLLVRGRKTGEIRSTPVNLLTIDGQRYLVAPRGQTQWVRNLRAAGEGQLRVGRRTVTFRPVELADEDKPVILRTYLKRWKWEVGRFFEGVDHTSPDSVLRDVAPGFPVFRITETA
ncbi:nitroreductase family deazaflavin-dependent oxidoreductase [Amycolatopsis thermophila]|uniref:Deazaflavin-dependent oxidoreductase (Nitroreductase family) n=1 Tax=Amycolatopsis thermophila TaxID=206084 RepID=A0ABU0ES08_9PSEU|nr:nitroreductase family deazaflavin-dependent oxidoreductase [Amycolatopsis thermophila]MDQ0377796.1 deazaflavin-dependent oxidoreductase (nitroreductase family) [Amycolatopsis thermophila]